MILQICGTADGQLDEVSTRTSDIKPLIHDQLAHDTGKWFPDENRILFTGREPGHGRRAYVQELAGGKPRAITPEGVTYNRISPDGARLAVAMAADFRTLIYPVTDGEPKPVPGLQPGEIPVGWSPDSRFLYCYRLGDVPLNIFKVELTNGRRTPWKQLVPPDPVGITYVSSILLSSDLKSYAYSIDRRLDVLYLLVGLN